MTPKIYGINLDPQTRCTHWNSSLDIIAIKSGCCHKYYACASCHQELEDHSLQPISKKDFDQPGVFCGSCQTELTVNQYLQSNYKCPNCKLDFNPGCSNHYNLYFEEDNT